MLGVPLGDSYISKLGGDERPGMVSSDGSFNGPNYDNLEVLVPVENDKLRISEGTGDGTRLGKTDVLVCGCSEGIKPGISDGEVMVNTLGAVDRIRLGGNEVSDLIYSGGSFYVPNYVNFDGVVPWIIAYNTNYLATIILH